MLEFSSNNDISESENKLSMFPHSWLDPVPKNTLDGLLLLHSEVVLTEELNERTLRKERKKEEMRKKTGKQ